MKILAVARGVTYAFAFFVSTLMLLPSQGSAEVVTVNGVDYELTRLTGGYKDGNNEALIKASPWYTPNFDTLAFQFANAFISADPRAYFVYQDNNNGQLKRTAVVNGQVYNGTENYPTIATMFGGNLMAATELSSVPEINAGALSQVLLMLLALLLVSRGRREADTLA